MPFLRRFRPFFSRMRSFVPLGFEAGMCLMSIRAAWILLSDQTYFDRNERAFAWLSGWASDEWQWGVLAAVAAALKLTGFLGFFARSDSTVELAFLLRGAGWAASFVFWTMLGLTFVMWNPWTISSGAVLMLGVFSFGMVLAGPVAPEVVQDGRG